MKTSEYLGVGQIYSRKLLREMFDVTDATLNTGVFRPKGHDSVWLFVTEKKPTDRTQYADYLDGDVLYWQGQISGRTDHIIIDHIKRGLEILLFYRKRKYEHPRAGFRYEGIFEYVTHVEGRPTNFTLQRVSPIEMVVRLDLEALRIEEEFFEGECKRRLTNYYERNPKLRAAAISFHGTKCVVCGFDFEAFYGPHGTGYIEVHHLRPVSNLEGTTKVDPRTDMIVVCANCHRMLHRRRDEVLSPEKLKAFVQEQKPMPSP